MNWAARSVAVALQDGGYRDLPAITNQDLYRLSCRAECLASTRMQ